MRLLEKGPVGREEFCPGGAGGGVEAGIRGGGRSRDKGGRRWDSAAWYGSRVLTGRGLLSPSASSILGMSRYFSATSKAVFKLPMGSS